MRVRELINVWKFITSFACACVESTGSEQCSIHLPNELYNIIRWEVIEAEREEKIKEERREE